MSFSEIIIALENRIVDKVSTVPSSKNRRTTRVPQGRLGLQQKKTEKVRATKEIRKLWISRCRLSTKEQVKGNGDSAMVKIGMRKVAKVERMGERIRGRRAAARNISAPLTKTTVRTLKSRPKKKRICKHGACWRKARTNSGRR